MRSPKVYKAIDIKNWNDYTEQFPNVWIPARPVSLYIFGLIQRLKVAYQVFIGNYDSLDWEDIKE